MTRRRTRTRAKTSFCIPA